MLTELEPVAVADKSVLRNLMELYLYDFSEFEQRDVDEHGIFGYRYLDHYWTDAERHPFFIRVDGRLAGFVLVRELAGDGYSISEFFVMRTYRRCGVGRTAMESLFGRFPGTWSFEVLDSNTGAQPFWREIASRMRDVREDHLDDEQPRTRFRGRAT